MDSSADISKRPAAMRPKTRRKAVVTPAPAAVAKDRPCETRRKERQATLPPHPGTDFSVLANDYAYLVQRWARRYATTAGAIVDWEDLVSVGFMGLFRAALRYEPQPGRTFKSYAEFRIRGGILDELRRIDPMTQPMRRKTRAFGQAVMALANELGRTPIDEELAVHLGVDIKKIQALRRETQELRFTELSTADAVVSRGGFGYPGWAKSELQAALAQAIGKLDERDQTILNLYYCDGLTMRELGEVLKLTEARVSQLHKAALQFLRSQLKEPGSL